MYSLVHIELVSSKLLAGHMQQLYSGRYSITLYILSRWQKMRLFPFDLDVILRLVKNKKNYSTSRPLS
jgi:hypothetical protein